MCLAIQTVLSDLPECDKYLVMNDEASVGMKVVFVGDSGTGKTCMCIRLVDRVFPEQQSPIVFDNQLFDIVVGHTNVSIGLWDTRGTEEFQRLRPLSYPATDVFALSFAVDSRSSFENIESVWVPELRHHCPNVPIILIGTKMDLRDSTHAEHDLIPKAECLELANRIAAVEYHECSSFTGVGVDFIMERAADLVIERENAKSEDSNCFLS